MMERGLSSPLSFFLTVTVMKPSTTVSISADKAGYLREENPPLSQNKP